MKRKYQNTCIETAIIIVLAAGLGAGIVSMLFLYWRLI